MKESLDNGRDSTDADEGSTATAQQRLLDAFMASVPEVAIRAAQAMVDEIPAYAAATDPAFLDEVRAHAVANFTVMARVMREGRSVRPDELAFLRAPTTRRALARFPLPAFLHAFRVGQRVAWEAVRELTDPGHEAAALDLVRPLLEFINLASTELTSVYLETEQLLLLGGERVRRAVIEDLLAGRPPASGPGRDVVRDAGLPGVPGMIVVSAEATSGTCDEHQQRSVASAVGRATGRAEQPLVTLRGDEIVAIAPITVDGMGKVSRALADVHAQRVARDLGLTLGSSTLVTSERDLPEAYREALQARAFSAATGRAVCLWDVDPLEYLTLAATPTAVRLVPDEIARFLREDLASHGVLTSTLEAYATANLSPTAAAAALHCHVNTVHNRLARIATVTGRDPRSFRDVSELLVARNLFIAASAPPPAVT